MAIFFADDSTVCTTHAYLFTCIDAYVNQAGYIVFAPIHDFSRVGGHTAGGGTLWLYPRGMVWHTMWVGPREDKTAKIELAPSALWSSTELSSFPLTYVYVVYDGGARVEVSEIEKYN